MRVVVADDQLIFAEAAAALLARHGHEVVGCGANADDVRDAVAGLSPDVVLVGLDADGNRCAQIGELARGGIGIPVVALSDSADAGLLAHTLDAGADAVFLKTEGIEELERLLGELTGAGGGAKRWSRGASAVARRSAGVTGVPSVTPRTRGARPAVSWREHVAHRGRARRRHGDDPNARAESLLQVRDPLAP